ncbi:MAG: N-acetylgalactosamine-6-sulfatase, partial [Verrucomicrobia bacterium]|nr:N-acetylgalactosamine-6-sulfatase [Verrucomicrobiota bacterium]
HPKITKGNFNGARAIISGDYKLVIDGDKNTGVELFNLKEDSAETNNIAEAHPDVVEQLSSELHQWQKGVLNSLMEGDYQ